jgi:RimJ/RimL family protein N-acetyltransferase
MTARDDAVIITERLMLRPPRADDLPAWAEFLADPVASRFIGGVQSPTGAWHALRAEAGAWALDGFGMFSVIERATGGWVGRLGPFRPVDWPGDEVGWGIIPSRWGRGYATEGAAAAMDWAVEVLRWDEVIHCIDPRNTASAAVARRLGSRVLRRRVLPPPYAQVPHDIWGQSREEWLARRVAP